MNHPGKIPMCMEDVSHDSEMTRGTVKLGLISLKGNIKNVFIHLISSFLYYLCVRPGETKQ